MLAELRSRRSAAATDRELRRRIDHCVSRALVDRAYARVLLADPASVVEDAGCSPQQLKELRSIRATDLGDFARQARALFWRGQPPPPADLREQPTAIAR
jgi:hypothetical protein